ncbi:hypothetical protein DRQ07_09275 [candidate division KSB1 bacterium]|nr:MAG: hypothetical protein DRQ07_09275 [candidate division KSB1 bacterium]
MNPGRLIKKLNKPYPYDYSVKRSFITSLLFAVFITLFLAVFHPFEVDYLTREYGQIIYAGYGLITFIVLIIMLVCIPKIAPSVFRESSWKVKSEIIHILSIFMVIGFFNAVYGYFLGYSQLNIYTIIVFELFTLTIGIIPVTFIIITEQNRFLKKNLELAGVLNSSLSSKSETADQILPEDESVVELCSEVVKEKIELHPADLLYIKAVENYIEIVTGSRGAQNKKILRCTLKNAEKALGNYNYLVRCHRSFIVNTSRIENVTGNSQGIKLKLTGCEIPVPVSRSNASKLKAMLS